MVLRRKTGRSDTDDTRAYRQALEDLDGMVGKILEIASSIPSPHLAKCQKANLRLRGRCEKLQAEREGLLAQRESDRKELRHLRSMVVDTPTAAVSTRVDGGSEPLLPPAPVNDATTEVLRVLHSHIQRVEDLVERLCGIVGSFIPAGAAEPAPTRKRRGRSPRQFEVGGAVLR